MAIICNNQMQLSVPILPSYCAHSDHISLGWIDISWCPIVNIYYALFLQPPPQAGAMVPAPSGAVVVSSAAAPTSGPVSGVANVGIRRAQIKQGQQQDLPLIFHYQLIDIGVHEVTLCKDAKGKCGVSLHPVNKGVFVCFIQKDSPAALSGLRFGDQILSVCHYCPWLCYV